MTSLTLKRRHVNTACVAVREFESNLVSANKVDDSLCLGELGLHLLRRLSSRPGLVHQGLGPRLGCLHLRHLFALPVEQRRALLLDELHLLVLLAQALLHCLQLGLELLVLLANVFGQKLLLLQLV